MRDRQWLASWHKLERIVMVICLKMLRTVPVWNNCQRLGMALGFDCAWLSQPMQWCADWGVATPVPPLRAREEPTGFCTGDRPASA